MDNLLDENLYIKNFEESCILNESNYFDLNNLDFNTQGHSNLLEQNQFDSRLNSDEKNQFYNQTDIDTFDESLNFGNLILNNLGNNQLDDQNIDHNLKILDDKVNNQFVQIADHFNEYSLANQIDNNLINNQIDNNLININQINNEIDNNLIDNQIHSNLIDYQIDNNLIDINQINNLNDEFKDLNFESLSNFFYTQNNDDNLLDNYLLNYEFDLDDKNLFDGLNNIDNHSKNNDNGLIENNVNQNYNEINNLNNESENVQSNNSNNINSKNSLIDQTNSSNEIDNEDLNLKNSKKELNRKLDEYIKSEFMNITEDFEINHDLDKYYCDNCNQTFYLILDFNEHGCNFKSHLIIESNNSVSNNNLIRLKKTILKCEYCLYSTPDKSKLKRHYVTHSRKKKFKCDYCGYKFTQSSSLKKHKIDFHLKNNPNFKNKKFFNEQSISPLFNEIIQNETNLYSGKIIENNEFNKENQQQQFDNNQINEQLIDQMNSLINLNQNSQDSQIKIDNQFINNQINSDQFIDNQINSDRFIDDQMNSNLLYAINNHLPIDYQSNYDTNNEKSLIYQIYPNQYIKNCDQLIENRFDPNDLDNYSKLFDFMY